MILHDIFSVFVVQDKLDLNLESLKKFCIANIDKNNQPIDFNVPELQPLLFVAKEAFNHLHEKLELSKDWHQEIVRVWFNVGYPEEIVKPHNHPESFFSSVFYLTGGTETSGKITFMNPIVQKDSLVRPRMVNTNNRYWRGWGEFTTEPNLFLMFPGWLWHYVTPGSNNELRISIAIDTEIKKNK